MTGSRFKTGDRVLTDCGLGTVKSKQEIADLSESSGLAWWYVVDLDLGRRRCCIENYLDAVPAIDALGDLAR